MLGELHPDPVSLQEEEKVEEKAVAQDVKEQEHAVCQVVAQFQ